MCIFLCMATAHLSRGCDRQQIRFSYCSVLLPAPGFMDQPTRCLNMFFVNCTLHAMQFNLGTRVEGHLPDNSSLGTHSRVKTCLLNLVVTHLVNHIKFTKYPRHWLPAHVQKQVRIYWASHLFRKNLRLQALHVVFLLCSERHDARVLRVSRYNCRAR